jgi:hypothetical protein
MTQAERKRSSHDLRVQAIAEQYRRLGYRVKIDPTGSDIPEFIADSRPDIIAIGPDESVVVEVRTAGKVRRADYWARLATQMRDRPGWRLELVVNGPTQETDVTTGIDEIGKQIEDGKELVRRGMLDAALLISWSALESAMRNVVPKSEMDAQAYTPASLIAWIYSEGYIDRQDYDKLMTFNNARNKIAHGFKSDTVNEAWIVDMRRIVSMLLKEQAAA